MIFRMIFGLFLLFFGSSFLKCVENWKLGRLKNYLGSNRALFSSRFLSSGPSIGVLVPLRYTEGKQAFISQMLGFKW